MRVLVIEDDVLLGDAIQAGLKRAGYAVDWMKDGISADQALSTEPYAAVILDLGLPRMSGLDVLRRMRGRNTPIPVLILTAMDTVDDRIKGLDAGADDYLVKPFDMGELTARLRALVRRASGKAAPLLQVAGVELDVAAHQVYYRQQAVELTAKEFAVLHALMLARKSVIAPADGGTTLCMGRGKWKAMLSRCVSTICVANCFPVFETIRGVGYLIPNERNG